MKLPRLQHVEDWIPRRLMMDDDTRTEIYEALEERWRMSEEERAATPPPACVNNSVQGALLWTYWTMLRERPALVLGGGLCWFLIFWID